MENEKKKKGILSRLTRGTKPKKSPCCGSVVIEEVPKGNKENEKEPKSPKDKKCSCCG